MASLPERDERDVEVPGTDGVGAGAAPAVKATRSVFRGVRKELSDDELGSPGVIRLIIDDLAHLDEVSASLEYYRDKFHGVDKELAVARQRLRASWASDIIFGAGTTLGGMLVALAQRSSVSPWMNHLLTAIGVFVVLSGVMARVIRQ